MASTHARFVRKIIDEADVRRRVKQFPAIARSFPRKVLDAYSTQVPYYCHFMEWRLARLPDPYLERFDQLLTVAEGIGNWQSESRSIIRSSDFSEFWSLTWQLQVAEYMLAQGYDLQWLRDGPDLRVSKAGETRYVECTSPRKHFGRALYLEEVLRALHPKLRVEHQMFLRRSMPHDSQLDAFLDKVFSQLLTPGFLDRLAEEATKKYPVLIPLPVGPDNLFMYMDGDDPDVYDPMVLPAGHGDIDQYLNLLLCEVVSNKQGANSLARHRPNAIFVNFLLGYDQQVAAAFGEAPPPDLGENIDELIWATVGIRSSVTGADLTSAHGWLP